MKKGKTGHNSRAPEPKPVPSPDSRLESATDAALAALSSEERMVLAAYFLDGRTLAEIARMLGVHESTISRKVDKLAKSLRKKILATHDAARHGPPPGRGGFRGGCARLAGGYSSQSGARIAAGGVLSEERKSGSRTSVKSRRAEKPES